MNSTNINSKIANIQTLQIHNPRKPMTTKPIGLVIKEITEEKKISAYALADKLGRGRTYAYDTFRRKSMSNEELYKWADLLEVTVEEILARQTTEITTEPRLVKTPATNSDNAKKANTVTKPDEYLLKYLRELEDRISEQAVTINQQAQTIQVLLGKSEPVSASAGFAPGRFFLSPTGTNLGTGRIFTF